MVEEHKGFIAAVVLPPHRDLGEKLKNLLMEEEFKVAIGITAYGKNYLHNTVAKSEEAEAAMKMLGDEEHKLCIYLNEVMPIKRNKYEFNISNIRIFGFGKIHIIRIVDVGVLQLHGAFVVSNFVQVVLRNLFQSHLASS